MLTLEPLLFRQSLALGARVQKRMPQCLRRAHPPLQSISQAGGRRSVEVKKAVEKGGQMLATLRRGSSS